MKLTRISVKHDSYHFEVSKVIDSLPLLFRACAKYGWGKNVLKSEQIAIVIELLFEYICM